MGDLVVLYVAPKPAANSTERHTLEGIVVK